MDFKNLLEQNKQNILGKDYIEVETLLNILPEKQVTTQDLEYEKKSIKEVVFYAFKNVFFWLSVLFLFLLISDVIMLNFNKQLVWNVKLYELFKVLFVLFNVVWISKTAAYYFDGVEEHYENGVPSPQTTAKYIATSFITYVIVSSFLYIYAVNFEALGVENLRDIIGTINIATMLLASTQFILYRWFKKPYDFMFSTLDDKHDSYTLWKNLNLANKFYICLILFISIFYILSQIYISVSQL